MTVVDWKILGPILERCAEFVGSSHFLYDPECLHITVRSCEGFRPNIDDDDIYVRECVTALRDFLSELCPFEIAFGGLAATTAGLFLKSFPATDIQPVRRELWRRLAPGSPWHGPEVLERNIRTSAHASVLLFESLPLAEPAGLVSFIEEHRATAFGSCIVREAEVVRYLREPGVVRIISLARLAFGKIPLS